MANGKTISIGVQLDMDEASFKQLLGSCEEFRKAMESAATRTDELRKHFVNFGTMAAGLFYVVCLASIFFSPFGFATSKP